MLLHQNCAVLLTDIMCDKHFELLEDTGNRAEAGMEVELSDWNVSQREDRGVGGRSSVSKRF